MTNLNTSPTTPSQAQSSDNQSYKVDIEAVYNDFIKQIDLVRSHVSTSKNAAQFKNFLSSLNSDADISPTALLSQLVIDPTMAQETRCHAFYRMLGLPAFEPGGTFYSPGYIHASTTSQLVANSLNLSKTKLTVAYNLFDSSPDLYTLMDNRENVVNQFTQIFNGTDINASVLALSGSKIRKFSVLVNTNSVDPFDSNALNQTYFFPNTMNVTGTADLTDYQDSNGIQPFGKSLAFLTRRSHLIKPFMVDPRVDLTVSPPYVGSPNANDNTAVCKLIGGSFPLDKSQHQYAENIYAPSPMIDTVCRTRLSNTQPTTALSERWKDIIAYVKNKDLVQDPVLLAKVYQNPTQSPVDNIFVQYLNIMRSMMDVLFDAIHVIQNVEGAKENAAITDKYHWVPIPDKSGPEYGLTTQGIVIGDELNTHTDNTISNIIVNQEINQINTQSTQNTRPDLGNFIDFSQIGMQPNDQSTTAFGNINQETLEEMTNDRTAHTDAANDALRKIEIIMGEFSGLGLCDIIAVYLALWTIDEQALVNMLDEAAFTRLYQDPTLRSVEVENRQSYGGPTLNITAVMTTFEQQVISIYAIMDKLWQDRDQNDGIQTGQ